MIRTSAVVLVLCVMLGSSTVGAAWAMGISQQQARRATITLVKSASLDALGNKRADGPSFRLAASCRRTSPDAFRCSVTLKLTFESGIQGASCRGITVVSAQTGSTQAKVDIKAFHCVGLPAVPGTLTYQTAEKAISAFARREGVSSGLGNVMSAYAEADTCSRVRTRAVSCQYMVLIADPVTGASYNCSEPPAIAYTDPGSSDVHVIGSFEASGCTDASQLNLG